MSEQNWSYCRRVKYYETDRMGVVHHSNYLRILEDARMDWLAANVCTYSDMERMGIIIPAVSAQEHFLDFLRYDDPFRVTIHLTAYTSVRLGFRYELHNTDTGRLCYTAETEHYFSPDGNLPGVEYGPMSIRRRYPELHAAFRRMLEAESKTEEKHE